MAFTRRSLGHIARILVLAIVAACGDGVGNEVDGGHGGAAGAAGSPQSDASNGKDGATDDVRNDGVRSDVDAPPRSDAAGAGGTGSGGAAGARGDSGPAGAAGSAGSGAGAGGAGNAGSGGTGGAATGGASGSAGSAGRSGSAGSGGSSSPDGGAGTAGADGGTTLPDGGADSDAPTSDVSLDRVDEPPVDQGADVGIDVPITCDRPAAVGGTLDESTIGRLAGVAHITTDLTLSLNGVSDLSVLKCLARVDGTLWIQANASLVIAELPKLATLSGALRVDSAKGLTTIAMPLLTSVGQSAGTSVGIDTLASLTSLSLPALAAAPGAVSIHDIGNTSITTGPLTISFGQLVDIGGLRISDNPHLQSIENLANVRSTASDLAIYRNNELTSLAFPHLTSVGGSVSIREVRDVVTMAFPELTMVGQSDGKSLDLQSVSLLNHVSFPKLASAPGSVYLSQLGYSRPPDVDPMALDFRSLVSIGGSFQIDEMWSLVELSAFPLLRSVGGTLTFHGLWNLPSLAFPALATVTGNVVINHLDAMPSATFPSLTSVGGALLVEENSVMKTFAVPVLATVGKDTDVSLRALRMPALESFSAPNLVSTASSVILGSVGDSLPTSTAIALGFGSLQTVGGDFSVGNIPRLTSLGGFPKVTAVQGDLAIQWNDALPVATLPSLTTVSGALQFNYSSSLATIALPALTSAGKHKWEEYSLSFDNLPVVTSISVPELVTTTSSILIHQNGDSTASSPPLALDFTKLAQVGTSLEIYAVPVRNLNGFAHLATVGWSLRVYENRDLASAVFPALTNVGGAVEVRKNDLMTSVSMPALTTIGADNGSSIYFDTLPVIASILLPHLTSTLSRVSFVFSGDAAPGALTLDVGELSSVGGMFDVYQMSNLQKLELPHLASVGGDATIMGNVGLLELPTPTSTVVVNGTLNITSNTVLPTCAAKAFAMACTATMTSVYANKPDTCGY